MKKIIFAIVIFLLFNCDLSAQVKQSRVSFYNGDANGNDYAIGIVNDVNGNTYVTGYSSNKNSGYDITTIKYDTSGKEIWVKNYNGPANRDDKPEAIVIDSKSNIYVTGCSRGQNTTNDYCTIKYDSEGNQKWVARYSGISDSSNEAKSIALDRDDNVYVTGRSIGKNKNYDFVTIKYSSEGKELWAQRFSGKEEGTNEARSLAIDLSGNIYVTGVSNYTAGSLFFCTVKYNSQGELQWYKYFRSHGVDWPSSIVCDHSNNIIVSGISFGRYLTLKYDPDGQIIWYNMSDTIGPSYSPYGGFSKIVLDKDDNIYLGGRFQKLRSMIFNLGIEKIDSSNKFLWMQSFRSSSNDYNCANDMKLDNEGNIYVTGQSGNYYKEGFMKYITLKFDNSGNQIWLMEYSGEVTAYNNSTALTLDNNQNIYVTGYIKNKDTGFDFCTIKYSQK